MSYHNCAHFKHSFDTDTVMKSHISKLVLKIEDSSFRSYKSKTQDMEDCKTSFEQMLKTKCRWNIILPEPIPHI